MARVYQPEKKKDQHAARFRAIMSQTWDSCRHFCPRLSFSRLELFVPFWVSFSFFPSFLPFFHFIFLFFSFYTSRSRSRDPRSARRISNFTRDIPSSADHHSVMHNKLILVKFRNQSLSFFLLRLLSPGRFSCCATDGALTVLRTPPDFCRFNGCKKLARFMGTNNAVATT